MTFPITAQNEATSPQTQTTHRWLTFSTSTLSGPVLSLFSGSQSAGQLCLAFLALPSPQRTAAGDPRHEGHWACIWVWYPLEFV